MVSIIYELTNKILTYQTKDGSRYLGDIHLLAVDNFKTIYNYQLIEHNSVTRGESESLLH